MRDARHSGHFSRAGTEAAGHSATLAWRNMMVSNHGQPPATKNNKKWNAFLSFQPRKDIGCGPLCDLGLEEHDGGKPVDSHQPPATKPMRNARHSGHFSRARTWASGPRATLAWRNMIGEHHGQPPDTKSVINAKHFVDFSCGSKEAAGHYASMAWRNISFR